MYPKRVPVADWSDKKDVTDRFTPYNWLFIQSATIEKDGEEIELHIPRRCMHCTNPPCCRVCPTKATWKRAQDGVVMMDQHRCIGCRFCMAACPYGVRSFNWGDPRKADEALNPDFPTNLEYPTRT